MKILLTTTSYQDTPGRHHQILSDSGLQVVRARGPLSEQAMLDLIHQNGGFDGLLNGDDQITAKVIDAALAAPTPLKVIAKYGIGLDSIDVSHATAHKIPVLFTPGVNHTTVAEHTFGLMIAAMKGFWPHLRSTKSGGWQRTTGSELFGKTLAILGLGRIGKEVAARARAFSMNVRGYSRNWDDQFAVACKIERGDTIEQAMDGADIITLHMSLGENNYHLLNRDSIAKLKKGAVIINTARGALVDEAAIAQACQSGQLGAYAADVLEHEPQRPNHPFTQIDNIIITPHIGSRTFESVERQAMRATLNLVNYLNSNEDFIQANKF